MCWNRKKAGICSNCKGAFSLKGDWHNNKISKRLDEEFPHNFSICDIDGAVRVFYKEDGSYKTRLVIYESKHKNESPSQTQLQTLYILAQNIQWENFDKYSGVFLIFHDEGAKTLSVNKIIETGYKKYGWEEIKKIKMDSFYNWVSAQDKR